MSILSHNRRPNVLVRRAVTVLLISLGLTVGGLFVGAGADGEYEYWVGIYLPKASNDHAFNIGWVRQQGGEVLRFREKLDDERKYYWNAIGEAVRGGLAYQRTCYIHYQRGFPWLWLKYYEDHYGGVSKHGFHRNAQPSELETYPRFLLDSINWLALIGNIAFYFSCTAFVLIVPRWVRAHARRKKGRCVDCGYDLQGTVSDRCPECGSVI